MTLHEQLHRIAETAPVADVPTDTWRRARRARRRDLVVATGTAVVVLVLALGGLLWLPPRLSPPVADGGARGAAVPNHLYPVPDRFSASTPERGWTSGEVSTDVAVGRAAAAWLTPSGLPVVVGATDGSYHLLELPEYLGNDWWSRVAAMHSPTIALSPDGRRLAYTWARFGPRSATEPIPSGIRVVDLGTGRVDTYPLPGAEGTLVERLVWSPDGSWIGWAGARLDSWTRTSMGGSTGAVGRIRLADGNRQELHGNGLTDDSVGIADDGTVAYGDEGRLRFWDGTRTTRAPVATSGQLRLAAGPGGRWAVPGVHTVTVVGGDRVREAPTSTRGATRSVPLGWAGDDVVVLATDGEGSGRLVLTRPGGGGGRTVAAVDTGHADSLSVATDLMTGDRPTVPRPAPEWPWTAPRWAWVVGVPAAGALLLGGWALLRRYRRRSAR